MKPTSLKNVRELAQAAGVSVATVSRVLNNHPNVHPKTRARVLALIESSGFRPSVVAQRLASGGTGQLCFLLANRSIVHSFHSRILHGVEQYCRQHHRDVVFTTFEYGPDEAMPSAALPRIVNDRPSIDGLVVAGTNYPTLMHYLESLELPHVVFGNNLVTGSLTLPSRACVNFEERGGARQATEFLLDLGHRAIAFVGNLTRPWFDRRARGYRDAMRARELAEVVIDIPDKDDGIELGLASLPSLLACNPRPTAVLAQDDETACGLLDGFRRIGLRVPEQVSVMGYDDIAEIRHLRPALTTVRVPKERLGWTMAERILAPPTPGVVRTQFTLPVELVVRDSCRAPEHVL